MCLLLTGMSTFVMPLGAPLVSAARMTGEQMKLWVFICGANYLETLGGTYEFYEILEDAVQMWRNWGANIVLDDVGYPDYFIRCSTRGELIFKIWQGRATGLIPENAIFLAEFCVESGNRFLGCEVRWLPEPYPTYTSGIIYQCEYGKTARQAWSCDNPNKVPTITQIKRTIANTVGRTIGMYGHYSLWSSNCMMENFLKWQWGDLGDARIMCKKRIPGNWAPSSNLCTGFASCAGEFYTICQRYGWTYDYP